MLRILEFRKSRFILLVLFAFALFNTTKTATALTLEESIKLALKNNPAIKEAKAKLKEKHAELKNAEAGILPKVGFDAKYVRVNEAKEIPEFIGPDPMHIIKLFSIPLVYKETYTLSLKLNWVLWGGGSLRAMINQAKLQVKAAEYELKRVEQQVRYQTEQYYYRVLKARAFKDLMQDMVVLLKAHYDRVKKMYDAGIVAKNDVLRVGVKLSNAKLNYMRAKNTYQLAVAAFKKHIGLKPSQKVEVKEQDIKAIKFCDQNLDKYLGYADKRYELMYISSVLKATDYAIKAAKGLRNPAVAVVGEYSLKDDKFLPENEEWYIGVALNWTLYDAGEISSKISKAKAIKEQLQALYKKTKDAIQLQIENAYLKLMSAKERYNVASAQVEKARMDYDMAVKSYKTQIATNLDVLDAQTALKEARTQLIDATYDLYLAWSDLLYATGYRFCERGF